MHERNRDLLPRALPGWAVRLLSVLIAACDDTPFDLPLQWTTSRGEPCCVRCGKLLTWEERLATRTVMERVKIGSCLRCRQEVVRELGQLQV